MTKENSSFDNFLNRELKKQPGSRKIEQIRRTLVEEAQKAIEKYKVETSLATPQAQEVLNQIIIPWITDFHASDTRRKIARSLSAHSRTKFFKIDISESIPYFWPRTALKEFHESKSRSWKPFQIDAEIIVRHSKEYSESIDEQLQDRISEFQTEQWLATAEFSGTGDSENEYFLTKWPKYGGGWALAVMLSGDRIDLLNEPEISTKSINPSVFVGLGSQIESGRVREVIEKSVKRELEQ